MVAVEGSKRGRLALGAGVGNVYPRILASMRVHAPTESIVLPLIM